jgi:periplasmic copper chaperone A
VAYARTIKPLRPVGSHHPTSAAKDRGAIGVAGFCGPVVDRYAELRSPFARRVFGPTHANRNRPRVTANRPRGVEDVSAEPVRTRGLRGLLVAGGIAVLLAGCAAGQVTSTAEIVPVVDGALAQVGTMALRAVAVSAPSDRSWAEGGSAPMQMYLVNNAATPDQLVSVTSNQSASVDLFPHGGVLSSGSSEASSSQQQSTSIAVPGSQSVSIGFDPGNPQVVLTGLTQNLFPAQTISVTFQFAKAGSVTAKVPVHLTSPPSATPTFNVSPTEGG